MFSLIIINAKIPSENTLWGKHSLSQEITYQIGTTKTSETILLCEKHAGGCDDYQRVDYIVNITIPATPPSDLTVNHFFKVKYFLRVSFWLLLD